jgi:hypothetical protein
MDIERVSEMEFTRWFAEELEDERLRDILREAYVAGFTARDSMLEGDKPSPTPTLPDPFRGIRTGKPIG